jgi:polyisoprenoid-binding protein YceI
MRKFLKLSQCVATVLLIGVLASSCANIASRVLPSNNQTLEPQKLRPGDYQLSQDHAALLFEVNHLGFTGYIGRFNRFSGTLGFDPVSPTNAKLDVTIDMASVDTNNAVLEGKLKESEFFNVVQFPAARFISTSVKVTGANTAQVVGNLTIRNVTKPVMLEVIFNGGAANAFSGKYTLGFSASGKFSRASFGLNAWAPAVGDEISLTLRAEFEKLN